jgi:hypothetical protein
VLAPEIPETAMKKIAILFLFAALIASPFFATYIVVLHDGTRYSAKEKWTIVGGKAIIRLQSGQSIQIDPALIDQAKSEEATRLGYGMAPVIDLNPGQTAPEPKATQPSLGSQIRLRKPGTTETQAPEPAAPVVTAEAELIAPEILHKFELAYENVGIFDRKITSTRPNSIRVELTVDTEERVFNAISATSFLMVRNAGSDTVTIETVELLMKMTNGGAAGRFKMTRADAEAIDKRAISQQDYFVRRVLY